MFSKRVRIQIKVIVVLIIASVADRSMDKILDMQQAQRAKVTVQAPVLNSNYAWLK